MRDNLVRARDAGDLKALLGAVLKLSRHFVPLLLLDNTEKAQQATWEQWELRLIEPPVSDGGVFAGCLRAADLALEPL